MMFADQIYERLHDDSDDLVYPPEPSPVSAAYSEFNPSFDDIPSIETNDFIHAFQKLLQETHFNHRIETTFAYRR